MNEIRYIRLEDITPSPRNPRKHFDKDELQELAQSIRHHGILQPITVRPLHDPIFNEETGDVVDIAEGKYEIVCGERRYRASKIAMLQVMPAIVRELSDDQAMDIMITENLQRKDVDPFEEAEAFQYLSQRGATFQELAERFGKSQSYIFNRLKLDNLIPELRKLYQDKKINVTHCIRLSKVSREMQEELYNQHYADDCNWYSLRECKLSQLESRIQNLSRSLENPGFDTTGCKNCMNNSSIANLFDDLKPVCYDKTCYNNKCVEYEYGRIVSLMEAKPDLLVLESWDPNNALFKEKHPEIMVWDHNNIEGVRCVADLNADEIRQKMEEGYRPACSLFGDEEILAKTYSGRLNAMEKADMEFDKKIKIRNLENMIREKRLAETKRCILEMDDDKLTNVLRKSDKRRETFESYVIFHFFKSIPWSDPLRQQLSDNIYDHENEKILRLIRKNPGKAEVIMLRGMLAMFSAQQDEILEKFCKELFPEQLAASASIVEKQEKKLNKLKSELQC